MTNLEKWRFYMKEIVSPDSFIDMGFYYMISSALQRRVWVGSTEMPLFPNLYVILVGDPGIGKGLVTGPVKEILRYHKAPKKHQEKPKDIDVDNLDSGVLKQAVEALAQMKAMADNEGLMRKVNNAPQQNYAIREQLLFPIAPDSTTFESLVQANANQVSFIKIPPHQFAPNGLYQYNSLCFILEEISSIFKKKTEDVVEYLLTAYDCKNYEYSTKHQGVDRVRNCCLNILGGTTPDFVQETFSDKLLTQGFASRTIFVYEASNRFNRFIIPEFTAEQLTAKFDIIAHLRQLSTLFGQITYTPEAFEILRNYFEEVHPNERTKADPKLLSYHARKNIHAQKMALAIHFGESLEMTINAEEVTLALNLLKKLENNMHLALNFGARNPLSPVSTKIRKYIERNIQVRLKDIKLRFYDQVKLSELEEALTFLEEIGAIMRFALTDEKGKVETYYVIKKDKQ